MCNVANRSSLQMPRASLCNPFFGIYSWVIPWVGESSNHSHHSWTRDPNDPASDKSAGSTSSLMSASVTFRLPPSHQTNPQLLLYNWSYMTYWNQGNLRISHGILIGGFPSGIPKKNLPKTNERLLWDLMDFVRKPFGIAAPTGDIPRNVDVTFFGI